ncbi:ATP-binding protein [Streptomyces sp. NPDC059787]|uniref:ATP-binding protein n=1 Tax=Streptomyces sp. NPDC059787 TaxID=3346947 RepID=UPI003668E41E
MSEGDRFSTAALRGRGVGPDNGEEVEAGGRPPAPVRGLPRRPQRFARSWPLQPTAVQLARIHARTWLVMSRWAGDQDAALLAIHELVENGVKHPTESVEGAVELGLLITEEEDLLIDVSDPDPKFADFDAAIAVEKTRGLGLVIALGGAITWGTPDPGRGKTVRVRMRPGKPLGLGQPTATVKSP